MVILQAQTESDLCKENVQLQQLVDSLRRDNVHYRQLETQYRQVTVQVCNYDFINQYLQHFYVV